MNIASRLAGFGWLIIIRHNDTCISAYGYNRSLPLQQGAEVKAGQKIAEMRKLQGSAFRVACNESRPIR
jgi:lipoprotein NlpD